MIAITNLLERYKIHSENDFYNLGPRLAYLLNDISTILIANKEKILNSPVGLSIDLRLNRQTLPLLSSSQLRNISKKISIYSAKTVIEIPDLDITYNMSGKYSIHRLINDKNYRKKRLFEFYKTFIFPYICLKEHILSGSIDIIPSSYNITENSLYKYDLNKLYKKEREYKLKSYEKEASGRGRKHEDIITGKLTSTGFQNIYPKKNDLLMQLSEDKKYLGTSKKVFLYLPYINGIDIETISRIKRDYFDELMPFYISTEDFFSNSKKTDSESIMIDLMKKVDYEVRKLNNLFKKLERSQYLKSFKVASGLGIMALSLLCESELAEAMIGSIGGIKAFDGVWNLAHRKDPFHEMRQSDFFIPWYINQKNE